MFDAQNANVLLLCPKGVAIMRHYACQPKLFLTDEPFDEFYPCCGFCA